MTSLDWALVCDFAYFDRADRLCMIGVETSGPIRTLPLGIHHLAIALHFRDRDPHDEPDVSVFVTSPRGEWWAADAVRDFCVDSRGQFLLVQMACVSLQEEGTYRLELACGTDQPVRCELSVRVQPQNRSARIHLHGAH